MNPQQAKKRIERAEFALKVLRSNTPKTRKELFPNIDHRLTEGVGWEMLFLNELAKRDIVKRLHDDRWVTTDSKWDPYDAPVESILGCIYQRSGEVIHESLPPPKPPHNDAPLVHFQKLKKEAELPKEEPRPAGDEEPSVDTQNIAFIRDEVQAIEQTLNAMLNAVDAIVEESRKTRELNEEMRDQLTDCVTALIDVAALLEKKAKDDEQPRDSRRPEPVPTRYNDEPSESRGRYSRLGRR